MFGRKNRGDIVCIDQPIVTIILLTLKGWCKSIQSETKGEETQKFYDFLKCFALIFTCPHSKFSCLPLHYVLKGWGWGVISSTHSYLVELYRCYLFSAFHLHWSVSESSGGVAIGLCNLISGGGGGVCISHAINCVDGSSLLKGREGNSSRQRRRQRTQKRGRSYEKHFHLMFVKLCIWSNLNLDS